MRLSEWQARGDHRDSMAEKVLDPARAALELLGAERDPECWIAWGDDPAVRCADDFGGLGGSVEREAACD